MSLNFKERIGRYIFNIRGWRTRRKIVVIESDDWGSIRMPSRAVYEKCLKAGYPVDKIAYERYDSLASEDDLELLFNLLNSFTDINGNHPVITANCLVANPDFEKIKADNFQSYYYELITDTFNRYPRHTNNFNLWKQGMAANIFHPQSHGREHLNVSLFMDAIRNNDRDARFGFDNQMPGCIPIGPVVQGNYYVESTQYRSLNDKEVKLSIFLEGLDLFEKLFGYKSESIIPPNFIWSSDYDKAVGEKGVKFFQGIRKMYEPHLEGKLVSHSYYMGKVNIYNQTYLIRNALFEPSFYKTGINDAVSRCLSDMAIAFQMHKPSVISCHRINFVGFIDESNRDNTLNLLNQLLTLSLKKWPDIEFMTSDQLGRLISEASRS